MEAYGAWSEASHFVPWSASARWTEMSESALLWASFSSPAYSASSSLTARSAGKRKTNVRRFTQSLQGRSNGSPWKTRRTGSNNTAGQSSNFSVNAGSDVQRDHRCPIAHLFPKSLHREDEVGRVWQAAEVQGNPTTSKMPWKKGSRRCYYVQQDQLEEGWKENAKERFRRENVFHVLSSSVGYKKRASLKKAGQKRGSPENISRTTRLDHSRSL